jgi:hypothetical protein
MFVYLKNLSEVLERDLSPRALAVYLHMTEIALATGAVPPQAHIAGVLKCSTRTVGRAIVELRREGLLGTWS